MGAAALESAAGPRRGLPLGPLGMVLALLGILASYMACLYGAEINQGNLIAFGFWSVLSVLFAILVDVLFKYVLILAILFVGALWWTESVSFRVAASDARALRASICGKVDAQSPVFPIKEWVC